MTSGWRSRLKIVGLARRARRSSPIPPRGGARRAALRRRPRRRGRSASQRARRRRRPSKARSSPRPPAPRQARAASAGSDRGQARRAAALMLLDDRAAPSSSSSSSARATVPSASGCGAPRCGLAGVAPQRAGERARDVARRRQRAQLRRAAARADGRQQPARRMADDEEQRRGGGSSRTFSSALAPAALRSSALSTMQTRQPPSPAVEPKKDDGCAHVVDRDRRGHACLLSSTARSQHERSGCDARRDLARRRMIGRQRKRSRALHGGAPGRMREHEARHAIGERRLADAAAARRSARRGAGARRDRRRGTPARLARGRRARGRRADAGLPSSAGRLRGARRPAPLVARRSRRGIEQAPLDGRQISSATRLGVARSHRSRRSAPARRRRWPGRPARSRSWKSSASPSNRSTAPSPRRARGPRQADLGRHVEDEGQVRARARRRRCAPAAEISRGIDAAEHALIGAGRIREAVAEHPLRRAPAPGGSSASRWSARAAANSSASACGPSGFAAPDRSTCADRFGARRAARLARAPRRRRRAPRAARRDGATCVDLPAPSPPSNVMKRRHRGRLPSS